jgi:hypothetical protein
MACTEPNRRKNKTAGSAMLAGLCAVWSRLSAMSAASAVEAAATMEATTTVEPSSTAESAISSVHTTSVAASITVGIRATPIAISRMSVEAAAIISAIPEPGRMAPVIPRTRTDKHAAYEIIRTVISVRADRRTSRVGRAYSHPNRPDAHSDAYLRLRIRQRHHQNRKQRQIFHVTHTQTPGSRPSFLLVAEAFSEDGCLAVHLTIASTYWNAEGPEKLLKSEWLISAMSVKISHLQETG